MYKEGTDADNISSTNQKENNNTPDNAMIQYINNLKEELLKTNNIQIEELKVLIKNNNNKLFYTHIIIVCLVIIICILFIWNNNLSKLIQGYSNTNQNINNTPNHGYNYR